MLKARFIERQNITVLKFAGAEGRVLIVSIYRVLPSSTVSSGLNISSKSYGEDRIPLRYHRRALLIHEAWVVVWPEPTSFGV